MPVVVIVVFVHNGGSTHPVDVHVVSMTVHKSHSCTFRPVGGQVVIVDGDVCQAEVFEEMLKALKGHLAIVPILVEELAQEVFVVAEPLGRLFGLQGWHRTQHAQEYMTPETHGSVAVSTSVMP